MMKHENDDECVFVYPPSEMFQVKVTPDGIDIYYGDKHEERGDLTILRIKVLKKGLSLKTFGGKTFVKCLSDKNTGLVIGDSVVLPVEDWKL